MYLGTRWDNETDGSPDAEAGTDGVGGDDGSGAADEDGITFVDAWTSGSTVSLSATVVKSSSDVAYLVGWFDWNEDGTFTSDEMVKFGEMNNGANALSLDIPASTSGSGTINMRFRLYGGSSEPSIVAPTGTVQNGEVEDYQRAMAPTSVTLASFDVEVQDDAMRLTWETATELDNVGFNVYRSVAPDGPYTKLNGTLIPVQNPGSTFGAMYSWTDTNVRPGVTYYYKLEDIDTGGSGTLNGPVSATLAASPTAVNVQTFAARGASLWGVLGLLAIAGGLVLFRRRRS